MTRKRIVCAAARIERRGVGSKFEIRISKSFGKIRNPNFEIRNKFEGRKIEIRNNSNRKQKMVIRFSFSDFGFVSDFDIRISNFREDSSFPKDYITKNLNSSYVKGVSHSQPTRKLLPGMGVT